jgi:hypothetical protein
MKVLYIGGAGRSGSTLLDMILGNLPGFFSIGEASFFWEYLARRDIACGCGNELSTCGFWSAVVERLSADETVDFDRLAILNKRLNRTRRLPRLTSSRLMGWPEGWGELVTGTQALYHTVWQLAKSDVLVDASKAPSHCFLLRCVSGIDLRILHLVRDGRAVVYSWSKRRKRHHAVIGHEEYMLHRTKLQAILAWIIENAFTIRLGHTVPHYTVLRYEDFVQDPYGELGRALKGLGLGDIDLRWLCEPTLSLKPTHGVGGNPVRFSKSGISIVSDEQWQNKMNSITKLSLGLVAAPVLSYFKYRPW